MLLIFTSQDVNMQSPLINLKYDFQDIGWTMTIPTTPDLSNMHFLPRPLGYGLTAQSALLLVQILFRPQTPPGSGWKLVSLRID